jgi:hypothetical protein
MMLSRQLQRLAELGRRQGQSAALIHHLAALHGRGRLNGLGLPVFAQHPREHLKDGDRRHHEGACIGHQGQEVVGLPSIGEHLDPARGIHHHEVEGHR